MVSRAGGWFLVLVGMVVAVRWRRVVIGCVLIFPIAKATWGRHRVVMGVVVSMRGKVC